ncbi:hypothetical protein K490DRAFT_19257, partial [Saccharata proteae CBS 121410]
GRYGVILDAGSSGTRVYTYRWLNNARARADADATDLQSLPKLETDKEWTYKIHPGISTFGETPELVGPDHLQQLLDHALDIVPKEEVKNTPVFLLATAGMRLLPEGQRRAVLDQVCAFARETTDFQLPDCDLHIQVIPGETEGLYGWIAANYLLGGFDKAGDHDHGQGHHTYGFLDMGGASAQIAFAPNATEAEKHANDLKLLRMRTVDGAPLEYKVFVTTWLGFGVNQARKRYIDALLEASPDAKELPDPCLPSGLEVTVAGTPIEPGSEEEKGTKPHLLGTGQFQECVSRTFPLLEKDAPCADAPCLLNGMHVPAIDFDVNHFVGVSEYWHTTHEIFEMGHKDKAYDFKTYQERVDQFCSQPWTQILDGVNAHQWGKKVDTEKATEVCFKASWLINVLHDGIGVPRIGHEHMQPGHNGTKAVIDKAKEKGFLEPFQAINKIGETEVSWTLGKMLLYASSQIPPSTSSADSSAALAVGFGTNSATLGSSIPPDFQYAGGVAENLNTTTPSLDDDDDWHDVLAHASPRRIPGLILFLLILAIASYLLCGRSRRSAMNRKTRSFFGAAPKPGKRRPGHKAGGFFGGTASPTYERVLEAGNTPYSDLEMGAVGASADGHTDPYSSDSSASEDSNSRVGKTSGWATPQLKVSGAGSGKLDSLTPGYFDVPGVGLGLGGTPMDRAGLLSRTESRERLSGMSGVVGRG